MKERLKKGEKIRRREERYVLLEPEIEKGVTIGANYWNQISDYMIQGT